MFRLLIKFLKFILLAIVILLLGQMKFGKNTIGELVEKNIKKALDEKTTFYEPIKAKWLDIERLIRLFSGNKKQTLTQ